MWNILHSLLGVPIPAFCRRNHKVHRDFSKVNQKNVSLSDGSRMGGRVEFRILSPPYHFPFLGLPVFAGNTRQISN